MSSFKTESSFVLLRQKLLSFPFLLWYASHDQRGFGNLMFPLWFIALFGWFICLLGCGSFHFVFFFFPFVWVLWLIYGFHQCLSSLLAIRTCTHQYTPQQQMDGVCGKEMARNTFHCVSVPKLTTVVGYIYQPSTCIVLIITTWYWWLFWGDFVKNVLKKKEYFVTDSLLGGGGARGDGEIAKTKIIKNFHHCHHCYHCLQYERVLKKF
jgi:hypothetical protein